MSSFSSLEQVLNRVVEFDDCTRGPQQSLEEFILEFESKYSTLQESDIVRVIYLNFACLQQIHILK